MTVSSQPAVLREFRRPKPTENLKRQIKMYPLAIAATLLSLERQQHSTKPCHSNSKIKFLPPALCLSRAPWCEWVEALCSFPYTCFSALKRPCNGPLTPGFLWFFEFWRHIGPIVGPATPLLYPHASRRVLCVHSQKFSLESRLSAFQIRDPPRDWPRQAEYEHGTCPSPAVESRSSTRWRVALDSGKGQ